MVRSLYQPNFIGSETLGHILSLTRNLGVDLLNQSPFAKYGILTASQGGHPLKYEWEN